MRRFWSRLLLDVWFRSVVPAWRAWVVAVVSAIVLGVSLAVPAQGSPLAGLRPVAAESAGPVVARDDVVSARIAARTQNRPVEVVRARTESSTTWALANGQFRKDTNPAPVRVQLGDGSWAGIDLSLIAGKNGWSSRMSPRPVTFSDGGPGPVATFVYEGRTLKMSWPGAALPAPTISGATATYAVSADQDLVLTATSGGFEQSLVLKNRPAAGAAAPVVTLPLTMDGLVTSPARAAAAKVPGKTVTLNASAAGGRSQSGGEATMVAAGDPVFAIQDARMFSAAVDARSHRHTQVKSLKPTLTRSPATGPGAGADAAVTLTPDKTFLNDPATVYPVTIDPIIVADTQYGDTWIDSASPDTSHWADSQLATGLFGSNLAGTLIGFDNTDPAYSGNHVTSASLNLFNAGSGSCTPSTLPVYPLTQGFDASTTWNAGGANWSTDYSGSKSFAHGFSGDCPAAAESIDVTDIVSAWSFGTIADWGFFLPADGSDTEQSKVFCSMDLGEAPCNDAARVPSLSVTYNSYPWDPQQVAVAPHVTDTNGDTYVTSLTPTFEAVIGNTDGEDVAVQGEVSYDPDYPNDGDGEVWFGAGAASAPLSLASVTIDTPLASGKHYRYRVRGGVLDGNGGTDVGPWSDYNYFTVDGSAPGQDPGAGEDPDSVPADPDPGEDSEIASASFTWNPASSAPPNGDLPLTDPAAAEALSADTADTPDLAVAALGATRPKLGSPKISLADCDSRKGSQYWVRDHWAYCETLDGAVAFLDSRGRILYSSSVRAVLVGSGYKSARQARFTISLRDWSNPQPDIQVSVTPKCTNGCLPTGEQAFPASEWNAGEVGNFTFTSNATSATDGVAFHDLSFIVRVRKGSTVANGDTIRSARIRCDSADYMRAKKACIFSQVRPWFRISRSTPGVKQAAGHIWDAYNNPNATLPFVSGKVFPGKYGSNSLMTRSQPTVVDANRTKAKAQCTKIWKPYYAFIPQTPQGVYTYDCDEFPFASSNQGWSCSSCGNNKSVRRIAWKDNQAAGRQFDAWLNNDRILRDVDGFQVKAE